MNLWFDLLFEVCFWERPKRFLKMKDQIKEDIIVRSLEDFETLEEAIEKTQDRFPDFTEDKIIQLYESQ